MDGQRWWAAVEERRRRSAAPAAPLASAVARVDRAAGAGSRVGLAVQRGLDRIRLRRARLRRGTQTGGARRDLIDPAEVRHRVLLARRGDGRPGDPLLAVCLQSSTFDRQDLDQARLLAAAQILDEDGWRIGFFERALWDLLPTDTAVVLAPGSFDPDLVPGAARVLVRADSAGGGAWSGRAWLADAWIGESAPAEAIAAAVRDTAAVPDEPAPPARVRLAFFPGAVANPYPQLLYCRAREHHVDVHPAVDPLALPPAAATRRDIRSILHIHWTHDFLDRAPNATVAAANAAILAERLRTFRAGGGTLVWTVHNVVPHEMVHPVAQRALLQTLAEEADVVHVMCPATAREVAAEYQLPADRIIVVGHSSYVGRYPDDVGRAEARRRLGLAPDARVAALVGAFRAYKGVGTLVTALDDPAVAALGVTALIAGKPRPDAATDALRRAAAKHPRVRLHLGFVPDEDLQLYFRAADVAVFPYRRTLNSGALMAALTFGTPVIAPAQGCLPDVVEPSFGILYDPADERGFATALARMDTLRTPQARAAARAAAQAFTPEMMSEQFCRSLLARLA